MRVPAPEVSSVEQPIEITEEMLVAPPSRVMPVQIIIQAPPAMLAGESQGGRTCAILSVLFALLAAVLCPPIFGIAGFTLGIIGTVLCRDKFLPICGMILSILGTLVGMILGYSLLLMH